MGVIKANPSIEPIVKGFGSLRKLYDGEIVKLGKVCKSKAEFDREKARLENDMFTYKAFSEILPTDAILKIKGGFANELFVTENNLYTLVDILLHKIGAPYEPYFVYTGRCCACHNDMEAKIKNEKVMDYQAINDPGFLGQFSDYTRCVKCGDVTEPIQTKNGFEIMGKNAYDIERIGARIKSEGRWLTKVVEVCSGDQKDVRDGAGLMVVGKTRNSVREKALPLIVHYNDDNNELRCRDYYPQKAKGSSDKCFEYLLYEKGGKIKRKVMKEIPVKAREGKGKKEFYEALHLTSFRYSGTPMEVQLKDVANYEKQNDPKSALCHQRHSGHYEEVSERAAREGWGPFHYKLAEFLEATRIFGKYNSDLYTDRCLAPG